MLASEHTFPKTRRGSLHTKNVAGRLPPSWLKRRHGSQETPCVHTPRGWKLASRTNSAENRGGLKSSGAQTTTQRCYAQLRPGALRFLPLLFCERSSLKEGWGLQEKKTGQYIRLTQPRFKNSCFGGPLDHVQYEDSPGVIQSLSTKRDSVWVQVTL